MEAKKWEHQKDCRGKLRKPQNVTKAYSSNYLLNSFSSPHDRDTHCFFQFSILSSVRSFIRISYAMHVDIVVECRKNEIHPTYKRNRKEGYAVDGCLVWLGVCYCHHTMS